MNDAPDDSRRRAAARDEEERPMERNVSIIRSDLASAAGLRIPLVTAR